MDASQKGFQRADFSTRLAILECAKLVDCSPLLAVMDGGKWSRVLRNGDVLTNPAFHSNLSQTWVTVNNFESYILVNSHTNTSHLYTSHSSKSQLIKYICELKFSIIFARAGVLTETKLGVDFPVIDPTKGDPGLGADPHNREATSIVSSPTTLERPSTLLPSF